MTSLAAKTVDFLLLSNKFRRALNNGSHWLRSSAFGSLNEFNFIFSTKGMSYETHNATT